MRGSIVCAVWLALAPTLVGGQAYAKLLVDGQGLAVTQLSVRQESGTAG